MFFKTMLVILVATFSLCSFAQDQSPIPNTGSSGSGTGSELDKNMKQYLDINEATEISTEVLVDMCQKKMWNRKWLEFKDSEFLLKSGLLEYLFNKVETTTDLEKKGKAIYRLKGLIEQNMRLSSDQAILQMQYSKKLKDLESSYDVENDVVQPEVLQKNLAIYLALPETTSLDELVEKAILKIIENGIKMDHSDVDILLGKKLYKYMAINEEWKVDATLLGVILMYNADEFKMALGIKSIYLITDVLRENEVLASGIMDAALAENGKGRPTNEVLREIRGTMTQKALK